MSVTMVNTEYTLYEELLAQLHHVLNMLPDKPEESAESTLRALWHTAAGQPMSSELATVTELQALTDSQQRLLEDLVAKRLNNAPLAHITRRQRFMDMEMLAGPEALIPRKETEILARAAIEVARDMVRARGNATVIDVCTGSGNVALAIANQVTDARVYAADISNAAIELARRNAQHLRLDDRVQFSAGDLLAPFDNPLFLGAVDVLCCNPPYINTAKVEYMPSEISAYEPRLAFDGGAFGVAIIIRLIQDAPRFLSAGGWLVFEVGLGQAPTVAKLLKKNLVFREVHTECDSAGIERVIIARV